jgi:hypothetical protein
MTMPCSKGPGEFAFERFGLYFEVGNVGRSPICDLHLDWANFMISYQPAYYTKPGGAVQDITHEGFRRPTVKKRLAEQDAGAADPTVLLGGLNLENGGYAHFVDDREKKVTDCWLFGPLKFGGQSFGSLVAQLERFQWPQASPSVDGGKLRYKLTFPEPKGFHYRPCTLWGTDYVADDVAKIIYAGGKPSWWHKQLYEARKKATPFKLPEFATRVVWKVEASSAAASECDLYAEHG